MADNERTTSTDATTDESGGFGRRQAIGLFGGATVAAWVAPQIISVPAASAATVAPGVPAAAVAVGTGGTVIVATPPSSGAAVDAAPPPPEGGWTSVGPIGTNTLNGIASNRLGGDSTWVAVGTFGQAFVSNDSTATTWTPHFTSTENRLRAITWTGSEFIAVGDGGVVIRSTNGTTWTTLRNGGPQAPALRGVASDGTTVVAVADDGSAISALLSDLSTWTPESTGAAEALLAVAAGPKGVFVAVGLLAPLPDDYSIVVRAVDGTWSTRASDDPDSFDDLYAVAVGDSGAAVGAGGSGVATFVRDQDPPTWTTDWTTSGPIGEISPIRGIAALPESGFILVGVEGQIAALDSDFQLVAIPSPTDANLNAVAIA